jgi:hypothetical protein
MPRQSATSEKRHRVATWRNWASYLLHTAAFLVFLAQSYPADAANLLPPFRHFWLYLAQIVLSQQLVRCLGHSSWACSHVTITLWSGCSALMSFAASVIPAGGRVSAAARMAVYL